MSRELGAAFGKDRTAGPETSQSELLDRVRAIRTPPDPKIHGILVQSPPPEHIDEAGDR